jgi:uncharacterized DUF497 family protein
MRVVFDPEKRARTLAERGLDMARAGELFAGAHLTFPDARRDYGEERWVTVGDVGGSLVVVIWTPRGGDMRVISMRKANERERKRYAPRLR